MSFTKFMNMQNVPENVHEGLLWLLDQDENFKQTFAKDILDGSDNRSFKDHCLSEVGRTNMFVSLGSKIEQYVSCTGLFSSEEIRIVPGSLQIDPAMSHVFKWTVNIGSVPCEFLDSFNTNHSIAEICMRLIATTEHGIKDDLIFKWVDSTKFGKEVSQDIFDEINTFKHMYTNMLEFENGIVLSHNSRFFAMQRYNGVYIRVHKNSEVYKQYELAVKLTL